MSWGYLDYAWGASLHGKVLALGVCLAATVALLIAAAFPAWALGVEEGADSGLDGAVALAASGNAGEAAGAVDAAGEIEPGVALVDAGARPAEPGTPLADADARLADEGAVADEVGDTQDFGDMRDGAATERERVETSAEDARAEDPTALDAPAGNTPAGTPAASGEVPGGESADADANGADADPDAAMPAAADPAATHAGAASQPEGATRASSATGLAAAPTDAKAAQGAGSTAGSKEVSGAQVPAGDGSGEKASAGNAAPGKKAPAKATANTVMAKAKKVTPAAKTSLAKASAKAKAKAKKAAAKPKAGWYSLNSAYLKALYLQVKGSKAKKGNRIILAKPNVATGQAFKLVKAGKRYRIQVGPNLKYRVQVDAKGRVIVATGGAKRSLFTLKRVDAATYSLVNVATGRALAVIPASRAGSRIVARPASASKLQAFALVSRPGLLKEGVYAIRSALSGKGALSPSEGAGEVGTAATVEAYEKAPYQKWRVKAVSGKPNTYVLENVSTGLRLQSAGEKPAKLSKPSAKASQRWLAYALNGQVVFVNKGTGLALRAKKGKDAAGTSVVGAARTNAKAQRWQLASADDTITSMVKLDFTLDQMARWQKAKNPYIANYTLTALKNALNPAKGTPYKFLDLRKGTGVSASDLDRFILTGGANGKLKGLGAAFVAAAQACKINEVYLLSHAIWESGWGGSELASGYEYAGGTIDGKKYKKGTYYNFFGIGAYDDSPLSGGRKMAIINGWNSPQKAVTGAAKWIAGNYVYATNFSAGSRYAQPTLYDMKWDTSRTKVVKGYGWHQYATDPNWAEGIGSLMDRCFKLAKSQATVSFVKPKYR